MPRPRWFPRTLRKRSGSFHTVESVLVGFELKEVLMGLGDKISNKAEEAAGKAKESAGDATNNGKLQAEGQADQASANTKQAGEHVKDAAKDAFGK